MIPSLFTHSSTSPLRSSLSKRPAAGRGFFHPTRTELIRVRAAREESFERAHGSFWEAGLLDRLSPPLTRYHD
jgi:hypothetical protein